MLTGSRRLCIYLHLYFFLVFSFFFLKNYLLQNSLLLVLHIFLSFFLGCFPLFFLVYLPI